MRTRDNDYDFTPEIYKVLSCTGYTGRTTKNENDILIMNNIINNLGNRGVGDRPSNRKTCFTKTFPKLVEEVQNKAFDENDLEGRGIVNVVIPSNIIA